MELSDRGFIEILVIGGTILINVGLYIAAIRDLRAEDQRQQHAHTALETKVENNAALAREGRQEIWQRIERGDPATLRHLTNIEQRIGSLSNQLHELQMTIIREFTGAPHKE